MLVTRAVLGRTRRFARRRGRAGSCASAADGGAATSPRPVGPPDDERARLLGGPRGGGRGARGARSPAGRSGPATRPAAIFEAQALFARDPGIVDPAHARGRRRRCRRPRRSSPAPTIRRPSWPPSTTSTSARGRPTSATSAGGSPGSSRAAATGPVARATAARRSSSPTTSTHRRSRRSGPSSSPGSRSPAARRPVTRRSSPAAWGSRSSSASAPARREVRDGATALVDAR